MCLMGFFYIYDLTNLDRLKGTYLSSMTEVMSGLVHWRERLRGKMKGSQRTDLSSGSGV